jgi:activating signal cointegrator 1
MRAISLWQPHGSLIITGAKTFETRHWYTPFRGTLILHAAKHWTKDDERSLLGREYQNGLQPLIGNEIDFNNSRTAASVTKMNLTFGALIGVAELVNCIPTHQMSAKDRRRARGFGNFARGRFAWELRNAQRFMNPVPFKGAQGFFNAWYDPDVVSPVPVKSAPEADWIYCPLCLNTWDESAKAGDLCANPECTGSVVRV